MGLAQGVQRFMLKQPVGSLKSHACAWSCRDHLLLYHCHTASPAGASDLLQLSLDVTEQQAADPTSSSVATCSGVSGLLMQVSVSFHRWRTRYAKTSKNSDIKVLLVTKLCCRPSIQTQRSKIRNISKTFGSNMACSMMSLPLCLCFVSYFIIHGFSDATCVLHKFIS